MDCTHPVIYENAKGLYCHVCGALLRPNEEPDKQEGQETKPAETPKKGVKRKAKTTVE